VLAGHNTGYSSYGPPTGKKIVVTCIANCVSKDSQIIEEFVIYNTGSLLRQLGFDLPANARELASRGYWGGFAVTRSVIGGRVRDERPWRQVTVRVVPDILLARRRHHGWRPLQPYPPVTAVDHDHFGSVG
jgi:hypothetical protein